MDPDFLPAAAFLPKLPKSNLDDRDFDDLVNECLLRIPRYCPEWTNYNPGDPGVTLIELFAWLVHQMLYRFNQVPRRHYVTFLELLGIRLQPPTPAQAELTFYLSKAQSSPKRIPAGTEIATVRTENQEAVVFTTDRELIIGQPQIKHFLRTNTVPADSEQEPTATALNNRFEGTPYEQDRQWLALETPINLFQPCRPNSGFYIVLSPTQVATMGSSGSGSGNSNSSYENGHSNGGNGNGNGTATDAIIGNVLALTYRGPAAVTTGINPDNPPLRWEAWTGTQWQDGILRKRSDDRTKGFSFDRLGESGPNPEQEGADILLHLPQSWPEVDFGGYRGHWIRCVYIEPDRVNGQYGYERSPEITGFSVRALGGAVWASECTEIKAEPLGTSDGKPGQLFTLEGKPILKRREGEHIQVELPNGAVENWIEVEHFGSSGPEDPHYLIDSQSGQVQFGPLIREASQLQLQTRDRSQLQSWGRQLKRPSTLAAASGARSGPGSGSGTIPAVLETEDWRQERQYGKVPPLGAEIKMTAYRVGGGSRGNVQAKQLNVLKTAIPYVKQVVNYQPAQGGYDAESLDEAVMRVPALLRTRKTAITPEEFERVAKQFQGEGNRRIRRAHCVTAAHLSSPGVIHLLVMPEPEASSGANPAGLHPDRLALEPDFVRELQTHLNTHKALGIQVKPDAPDYVGIQAIAQVMLYPQHHNHSDQTRLAQMFKQRLYTFFHPLLGGIEGQGWPLGRAARTSDVIALLQSMAEVHYVGQVALHSLRRYGRDDQVQWVKTPAEAGTIPLSTLELACSCDRFGAEDTAHSITFLTP